MMKIVAIALFAISLSASAASAAGGGGGAEPMPVHQLHRHAAIPSFYADAPSYRPCRLAGPSDRARIMVPSAGSMTADVALPSTGGRAVMARPPVPFQKL